MDQKVKALAGTEYEKARRGDSFHPTKDVISFYNNKQWSRFFTSQPTCWKAEYDECLSFSYNFPSFKNVAAGSTPTYHSCKYGLKIRVDKPSSSGTPGPAAITCFERDY